MATADIKRLFEEYKRRADELLQQHLPDENGRLIALENQMADDSGLHEGDRLELRAFMEEYRRLKMDSFEAGAENGRISKPDSGPRSGEYDSSTF
jgi:hypothetical protein